jgi:hypothetical protein
MKLIQLLLVCAFGIVCLPALAQWQWLDKDGRKVFSDRSPPPDIPESSILRKPRGRAGDYGAPTPVTTNGQAKPAGGDSELLDKKKQVEKQATDAETAKRKAEEERVAKLKAENCTRAQQAKAGFDSGARMARTNEKGEREFFDEGMRAEETQRLQGIIQQNCQ